MARTLRKIYQIKLTLQRSKPPIWRRFIIDSTVSLPRFHDTLQIIMGWTDSHLHQFIVGDRIYSTPEPDWDFTEVLDEKEMRLDQLLKKENDTLVYEYDFGDGWNHEVLLEKILPFTPDADLPRCIKGSRACPPEDIGGVWGYYEFLEALNDPTHPNHQQYKEWIGGEFDPVAFDLDEVNHFLNEYWK